MSEFSKTLAPKTDQLNADDLLGGWIDVTITGVEIKLRDKENQKVWIYYAGDNGKPYKPGIQMRHVMFRIWGDDEQKFIGKSMRLYRDDSVRMGKELVGGIRISHMSGISEEMTAIIPVSRGMRKGWVVKPMPNAPQTKSEPTPAQKAAAAKKKADEIIALIAEAEDALAVADVFVDQMDTIERLRNGYPTEHDRIVAARDFKNDALSTNQGE